MDEDTLLQEALAMSMEVLPPKNSFACNYLCLLQSDAYSAQQVPCETLRRNKGRFK